jgi:hypothetical protein
LVVGYAIVMADVNGSFKSVSGNKITVNVKEKGEKKGTDKTFELADNVKVVKMDKKNKVDLAGGVKSEELKAGVGVTLVESGGKVTEIVVKTAKKKDAK